MTITPPPKPSIKVCAGELRPCLMTLLGALESRHQILLSSPGLLATPSPDLSAIAKRPWRNLSVQRARDGWLALQEEFAESIDRLAPTLEWERQIVDWLAAFEAGRLHVRYWPKAPLFTRLLSRPEATITFSGPLHDRLDETEHELRVELRGAEHERARTWFDARYQESTDVGDELAQSLRESWAGGLLDPKDAYLKVLADYFSGLLDGLDAEADDNPMLEYLTEFQVEAYHYAKSILRRFGGVFLADVVGLGKTFIAMALLRHLQSGGEHAVVVAPPKVLPAWEELAREFRVELAAVSLGKLSDLEDVADREVLVIDESHNFRNTGTGRYDALSSWLRPDGSPSHRKVLLLSATPQNNHPKDVKHQLEFFPDNLTRLPYRGESLDSWFREVQTGRAQLTDMLQHVVVRRTRGYIKRAFPTAALRKKVGPGEYEEIPIAFPRRLSGDEQCLRYSIADSYHGDIYNKLLRTLSTLKYPLHGLGLYVAAEYRNERRVQGLQRAGASLRGLYKVMLLKRLESSVFAFRKTLVRLGEKLAEAARLLKDGKVVVRAPADGEDASDEEVDPILGGIPLPAAYFESRLMRDLREDLVQVRELQAWVQDLGPDEDAKLARLRTYLQARRPAAHRTLVFTQFADTADYLGKHLGQTYGRTKVVSGRTGGGLTAARRFAPKANRANVSTEDELDLLISTDMLSEGVNLQDADTLINYDLHWNPVRLIQRAGRIDRIGSEHDEIHVSSFFPEGQLEAGLHLEEVLRRRIKEFVAVFGEDGAILPGGEKPDVAKILDAFTGAALEGEDEAEELDALNRHRDRLLEVRRTDPERFARVVGIRPGRRTVTISEVRNTVATRLGWLWSFWDVNGAEPVEIDTLRGLDEIYNHSNEAPSDLRIEESAVHLEKIVQARDAFIPIARTFRAQRTQPRLTPSETFVLNQLETYLGECVETRKELAKALIRWAREGHAQAILSRRARIWRRKTFSPGMVFNECRALYARVPPRQEELGEPEVVVGCFNSSTADA